MSDRSQYPVPPDPLAGREEEFGEASPLDFQELPPVTPPSAGFIVQLFLVPALIVTVVIGVYLLFGQLAAGETDWRKQLTDIRSDNPHVRWRGALGLAQMLQADATADGVRLAENRDVATELAGLLQDSLARASAREEDYKQQEFLARTLGLIDVPDVTLPVLVQAMEPSHDREVRKNSIASVATIAHRGHERGRSIDGGLVVPELIEATDESDAMIRHVAAYTLGLFDRPAAQERLVLLLEHGDHLTRANAAFALARQGSTAGVPVLEQILRNADDGAIKVAVQDPRNDGIGAEEIEALVESPMLTNTIHAIDDLSPQIDQATRAQLIDLLQPVAREHVDGNIRLAAQSLIEELGAAR